MTQNHLTLTRQSLYDLVWSTPMSTLALDFGITDVGLAKRCRAVDVPIPYRGYWARVAAGQSPAKIPLPKYRTRTPTLTEPPTAKKPPKEVLREGTEPAVNFGFANEPTSKSPPNPSTQSLQQRIEALNLAYATTIADTVPAVRRTAKHHKHTHRAELRFTAADRTGPLIELRVSKESLTRALLLADRLIKTAAAIGWPLTDPEPPKPEPENQYGYRRSAPDDPPTTPPPPAFARLLVDGEPMAFLIEERYAEQPREPTSQELAREKRDRFYQAPGVVSAPTGALRIVRIDEKYYYSTRRSTWYDNRSQLVETKIPKMLADCFERAQEIKTKRAEDEREARECEKQRRLKEEQEERRAAHAKLIRELERQAGAWARARFLRRYVQAARRALNGARMTAPFRGDRIDFLEWAEGYITQLDPLSDTPANPDHQVEKSPYYRSDEELLKKALLRFFNLDGHLPSKVLVISTPHGDTDKEEEPDFDDD